MIPATPLVADAPGVQSQVSPQACELAQLPPDGATENLLEELIEMRYQQHLAQRALQDLFENEALQTLEG